MNLYSDYTRNKLLVLTFAAIASVYSTPQCLELEVLQIDMRTLICDMLCKNPQACTLRNTKFNNIHKIMNYHKNYLCFYWTGTIKETKLTIHSFSPAHGELDEIFWFISVAPSLSVLHAFTYDLVNVKDCHSFFHLRTHKHSDWMTKTMDQVMCHFIVNILSPCIRS